MTDTQADLGTALRALAAKKAAERRAAAEPRYAMAVVLAAAGTPRREAELEELSDVLTALGRTPEELSADVDLCREHTALTAAVAAIPSAEEQAAVRKKLEEEAIRAGGHLQMNIVQRKHSAQMVAEANAVIVRFFQYGIEYDITRQRLATAAEKLAHVFAHASPAVAEAEPVADPKPTRKAAK